jgi:hypothetical protein
MEKHSDYLTTYRCIRMRCAMTVRLLNPIDRCPRCRAVMTVVEQPRRDVDELIATSMKYVLAGFDTLLGERVGQDAASE